MRRSWRQRAGSSWRGTTPKKILLSRGAFESIDRDKPVSLTLYTPSFLDETEKGWSTRAGRTHRQLPGRGFILIDVQVQILYFGILKDLVACEREVLLLPEGAQVEEVIRLLRARASNSKNDMWSSLAVAVNREYATRSTVLHEADEVALLPPVSGGSQKGWR